MKDRKPIANKVMFSRQLFMLIYDVFAVNFGYVFAILLTPKNYNFNWGFWGRFLFRCIPSTVIFIFMLMLFGIYRSMWKYAGAKEFIYCVVAVGFGSVMMYGVDKILLAFGSGINFEAISYVCAMLLDAVFICGFRVLYRMFRRSLSESGMMFFGPKNEKRIMIIGAGDMGMIIIKELEVNNYSKGKPVLIVDDNPKKQGQVLRGVPVMGGISDIPWLAEKYNISEIIFCIPSAENERRKEIMEIAIKTGCTLKISPTILEMNSPDASERALRNVEITDLLSRPEVHLSTDTCGYIKGKTVLITGCGSIGSEICRQVAKLDPKRIVLFDIYENTAFLTKTKLDDKYKNKLPIFIRIGSVRDEERLNQVFDEFKPEIVFHAAAHKHVPLMESSPCEAVKNNIFGTYNTAKVAMEHKAEKFIILSTDKAVNPANVMGATKRVTELIIQYFNRRSDFTTFAAVRFGNVLGSDGSVIPIFRSQIEKGGPVTVTDPEITRYFMTVPEAAQLVVQAGNISKGGEVFVLDMGEPVKILSLAENLIRLSGFEPYKDIDIKFTGLRPGEKLYEELSMEEELEGRQMTDNNKIFVTPLIEHDDKKLEEVLEKLKTVTADNVRDLLKMIVPNFKEQE